MHNHFVVPTDGLRELFAPGRLSESVQNSSIHSGFLATEGL